MMEVSGKAMVSRDSAYCASARHFTPRSESYRSRDIGTGDSLWWGVEEVESGGLADLGNDLGSDTEG